MLNLNLTFSLFRRRLAVANGGVEVKGQTLDKEITSGADDNERKLPSTNCSSDGQKLNGEHLKTDMDGILTFICSILEVTSGNLPCFLAETVKEWRFNGNGSESASRQDNHSLALQQHYANVILAAQLRNPYIAKYFGSGTGLQLSLDKVAHPIFEMNEPPFHDARNFVQPKLETDDSGNNSDKDDRPERVDESIAEPLSSSDRSNNERFASNGSSSAITA